VDGELQPTEREQLEQIAEELGVSLDDINPADVKPEPHG
jgi:hypothetical protein